MSDLGERLWYAIYSKPQKEEAAHFYLRQKGVEVFLPKLLLPSNQNRRRRVVPLFPSYLFARIDVHSEEYGYVIWSPGVKRLVSFDGVPAPIDDTVVDFLMKEGNAAGLFQPVPICRLVKRSVSTAALLMVSLELFSSHRTRRAA
jgi:transcription antitermination factor NusG